MITIKTCYFYFLSSNNRNLKPPLGKFTQVKCQSCQRKVVTYKPLKLDVNVSMTGGLKISFHIWLAQQVFMNV